MKKRVDYQLYNRREQLEQRRHLRSNGTPAEAAMWKLLKNKKIMGLQWRRQFSVGSYILDFYCPSLHLCIELDGEPHYTPEGAEQDKTRTEWLLNEYGIHILRFENHLVFDYPQSVIAEIELTINELQHLNSLLRSTPSKTEGELLVSKSNLDSSSVLEEGDHEVVEAFKH